MQNPGVLLELSVLLLIPRAVCKDTGRKQLPVHPPKTTTYLTLGCCQGGNLTWSISQVNDTHWRLNNCIQSGCPFFRVINSNYCLQLLWPFFYY